MWIDSLQQLATSLDDAGIGLLELRGPGVLLRLGRDAADIAAVYETSASAPSTSRSKPSTVVTVAARCAGVFLHAHPMQSTPLAPVGTPVRAGATIALLQIGALLLPVSAPRAAVVARLLVAHGATVGYGTPLVDLAPD
jgi:acetyl-CoA carboxylase biotin carboxyl carrier protein